MGVHGWRDMNQENLTEEGMRQGVYDSDVFVLFLTNSVLSRKFCQKELSWAITFGKPILVVCEDEERFWPFDYERWATNMCTKVATARQEIKGRVTWSIGVPNGGLPFDECPAFLVEWIRSSPRAEWMPFRRRDFEVDALARELIRRAGSAGLSWGGALTPSDGERVAATALTELPYACRVHFVCRPSDESEGDGSEGDRMRREITAQLLALNETFHYRAHRELTCTYTGDGADEGSHEDAAYGLAAVDAATHVILILTHTHVPLGAPWIGPGTRAERELAHATRPVELGGKSSEKIIVVYSKPRGYDSTVFGLEGERSASKSKSHAAPHAVPAPTAMSRAFHPAFLSSRQA